MKWTFNFISFWNEKKVKAAGEASLNKYGKLYKKLEQYDKGEISQNEILAHSSKLRTIIQSTQ